MIKVTLSNERLVLLSFWFDDRPLFREDSSIGFPPRRSPEDDPVGSLKICLGHDLSKERNMFLLSLAWATSEPVRAGSQ